MEKKRRRGQTSPGEERGNETGKVFIVHGRVEFCEATPMGLADESKESLYRRQTGRDLRTAELRSAYYTRKSFKRTSLKKKGANLFVKWLKRICGEHIVLEHVMNGFITIRVTGY